MAIARAKKVEMTDVTKVNTIVKLKATSPNELIGEHTVYSRHGIFVFHNGELEVTQENAEKLKGEGII